MTRGFWLRIHRWAGLGMAGFLVLVGLTGSVMAFYREIDAVVNPQLYGRSSPQMNAADLGAHAEKIDRRLRVESIVFGHVGDAAEVTVSPRLDPVTGEPYQLSYNQLLLDPGTGEELGRRTYGAIGEGLINLMPFLYLVHSEIVPGWERLGWTILGIVALIWTLDCFVGFYLTLPQPRADAARQHGVRRRNWRSSWRIKRGAGSYRLNLDLHRASGLWLWTALLVFAWTGVYMGLWDTVYTWATRSVLEMRVEWTELSARPTPLEEPSIQWQQAVLLADRLMREQASEQGFRIERAISIGLNRGLGVYRYEVRSDRDVREDGRTRLYFDANSGVVRLLELPTGQYAGNTVTTWVSALHMGAVWGLPYRVFVCVLGMVVVLLSTTGVVVWWKKRDARLRAAVRRVSRTAISRPDAAPRPA